MLLTGTGPRYELDKRIDFGSCIRGAAVILEIV